METLEKFLMGRVDGELFSVLKSIVDSVVLVTEFSCVPDDLSSDCCGVNVFGDKQVPLDIVFDDIVTDELRKNELVRVISSEERDGEVLLSDTGKFAVCYDPLDGSSLVDVNLAIGSIFGIYRANSFVGVKGRDQLAVIAVTYGPKTTLLISVGDGVFEFELCDEVFVRISDELVVSDGKMFAPGNMAVCSYNKKYFDLVNFWINSGYKLRYSGAMVPDISQILIKGNGIFSYPADQNNVNGKLRLLYECAPMSFLVEQAGGSSSNGFCSILDVVCTRTDQCTPIFVGSCGEVARCEKYLN